jgi:hypothetical protein
MTQIKTKTRRKTKAPKSPELVTLTDSGSGAIAITFTIELAPHLCKRLSLFLALRGISLPNLIVSWLDRLLPDISDFQELPNERAFLVTGD